METVETELPALPPSSALPIAHLSPDNEPERSLCGARILGVEAWPPYDLCVVCLDLARSAGIVP